MAASERGHARGRLERMSEQTATALPPVAGGLRWGWMHRRSYSSRSPRLVAPSRFGWPRAVLRTAARRGPLGKFDREALVESVRPVGQAYRGRQDDELSRR